MYTNDSIWNLWNNQMNIEYAIYIDSEKHENWCQRYHKSISFLKFVHFTYQKFK